MPRIALLTALAVLFGVLLVLLREPPRSSVEPRSAIASADAGSGPSVPLEGVAPLPAREATPDEPAPAPPSAPLRATPSGLNFSLSSVQGTPIDLGPEREIMGVVTDHLGRPLAGVDVQLGQDFDVEIASFAAIAEPAQLGSRAFEVHHTRIDGSFVIPESQLAPGSLLVGRELRFGNGHSQSIDVTQTYQVVALPDPGPMDATWTVDVVAPDGRPLPIASVELQRIADLGAKHAWRPDPGARSITAGRVVLPGLAIGRWRLTVDSPEALIDSVTIDIADGRGEHRSTLELDAWEDGLAEEVEPTLTEDGRPWVDPDSGMGEWLPEDLLRIGENRRDHHFAQTLRFAPGKVRAAQLWLEIEGNSGMSGNDALYLEHTGGHDFVWGSRIEALVRGRYRAGGRRRVRVDLSELPVAGESPVDLRPWLEDGRLDVVVQDDTVVHAVRLRLVR